jgi:hypothetical protein
MDVTVGAPLLTAAFWRSSSLRRLPASPSCGSSVSSATSSPGSGIGCSPRSSSARAAQHRRVADPTDHSATTAIPHRELSRYRPA